MDTECDYSAERNNTKLCIISLKEKLKCLICEKLLVEPYLLWCQHSVCKNCTKTLKKCPKCGYPLTLKDMAPNLMLAKLVNMIRLADEMSNSVVTVEKKITDSRNETREEKQENSTQVVSRTKMKKGVDLPELRVKIGLMKDPVSLQTDHSEEINIVGRRNTDSNFKSKFQTKHTEMEEHKPVQGCTPNNKEQTEKNQEKQSRTSLLKEDHSVNNTGTRLRRRSSVKSEDQRKHVVQDKETPVVYCNLTKNNEQRTKSPIKQREISSLESDNSHVIIETCRRRKTSVKLENQRIHLRESKRKPVKQCTFMKDKEPRTKTPNKQRSPSLLEERNSVAIETNPKRRRNFKCETKTKYVRKDEKITLQESSLVQSNELKESSSSSLGILSTSTPKRSTVSVKGKKDSEAVNLKAVKDEDTTYVKGRQYSKLTPKLSSVSRISSPKSCIVFSSKKPQTRSSLNAKGETPLQIACRQGKLELVQELLNSGANPNVKDYANWTPLCDAVSSNNVDIVKVLLEAGATVNVPAHLNTTALVEAVLKGNKEMVSLLLRHGADMHQRTIFNNTAFSIADDEMKALMESKTVIVKKPLPTMKNIPTAVLVHNLPQKHEEKVMELCRTFNLSMTSSFIDETNHIVVEKTADNTCHGSADVMQGILRGCSVVGMDWVMASIQAGQLLPPDQFEPNGTNDYPDTKVFKRARINKESLLPKLFDGCHISLQHDQDWPDKHKNDLLRLIQESGAHFLARECDPENIPENESTVMYHVPPKDALGLVSHIILFQPHPAEPLLQYNMPHVKSLSVSWFLQCIKSFSIF